MKEIFLFAGAGISQESGLSTFRCNNGLWEQYDVMKICNYPQFLSDTLDDNQGRKDTFDFYNMRKREIQNASPNAAHYAVADWQKSFGVNNVKIVTSNIDDLFERAGCENVVHVHGDTKHMKCAACDHVWFIGDDDFDIDPSCPHCDSIFTKPNIVFFGETAPEYKTMYQIFNSATQKTNLMYAVNTQDGTVCRMSYDSSGKYFLVNMAQ